jgi:hypothetical protein
MPDRNHHPKKDNESGREHGHEYENLTARLVHDILSALKAWNL